MRIKILVFFAGASFLLLSCNNKRTVPATVDPYLSRFEADARSRGRSVRTEDLVIEIKANHVSSHSSCRTGRFGETPHIVLRESDWNDPALSPTELESVRENILYHEIGHCLYGFDHTSEGIMRAISYEPAEYEDNRAPFLDQFFDRLEFPQDPQLLTKQPGAGL